MQPRSVQGCAAGACPVPPAFAEGRQAHGRQLGGPARSEA